jgi:uncharacterized protein with GYD domain
LSRATDRRRLAAEEGARRRRTAEGSQSAARPQSSKLYNREAAMPMYLFQGKYTLESFKRLVDKPQDRTEIVRKMAEAGGGKLHHLFFAFGDYDVVALFEFPDNSAMAAQTMAAAAGGSLSAGKTTVLLSYPEAVQSMKKAQGVAKAYDAVKG